MPSSRNQQPPREFTTTSMKLRGEIREILLPKITELAMLRQPAEKLVTSRSFQMHVRELEDTPTIQVVVQYKSIHIGSTVAEIHLQPSAADLNEAIDALVNSLTDGWIWEVR